MHRFFVEPWQIPQGYVEICGRDVNHIRNVLRMTPGDRLSVSDESGTIRICEVESLEPDRVVAAVREGMPLDGELSAPRVLDQGLPKGDKMELIVQKAVELGAARIVPVAMKRSVVKLDRKKAETKRERWQKVAESAAKQSGRSVVPQVGPVMTFAEALRDAETLDFRLVPYERADGMEAAREALGQIQKGRSVGVFIGPEGGFDDSEILAAGQAGAKLISLGRRILRTETAGLCILSVLMFRLED